MMLPSPEQHPPAGQNPSAAVENEPVDLSEILNLFDFEKIAERKMSRMAFEYVASGAADEITLRWNRQALDGAKLIPNVLHDVRHIDTRSTLFGHELPYPVLIAPSAYHKIMHPEGELATARGANAAKAVYVVSSFTTTPLEEITAVATEPLWFQLYVRDDRAFTRDLIQKVESLGCKALCVTVDTPITGVRNRQLRAGFQLPGDLRVPYNNGEIILKNPPTWKDMEWIISFAKIPVLLKGILHPDDAEKAVEAGAAGIIVSNHGGRNLDTVPATIEVLPRIADRVNKKIPVLMDGGIRRGTDVLKALALGANAVLLGKPVCYALAAGGAEGVAKVLDILKTEFEMAMKLSGRTTIASIDASLIWNKNAPESLYMKPVKNDDFLF